MGTALERIVAGEKSIATVFSDAYAFSIPPYQRPYAWEIQQARELFDDLSEAMQLGGQSDSLYFLGSIVLVKTPSNPDARIVDGQQRLTTLTILLGVLRDLTDNVRLRISRDKYIKQAANPDLGLPERLRLQLRQHDQPFFEKTIQRCDATKDLPRLDGLEGSQARIVENADLYLELAVKLSPAQRDKLIKFVLTNCYLVVVEVPTDTAARRIFTVLNARGLDLIATDILKADLLERAGGDLEGELSTRWEEIELELDRDRFGDLFTHIRMIFQREKPRSALEVGFPEYVVPFRADARMFVGETLEPFANALSLIGNGDRLVQLFGARTANRIRSLSRLDNKDWEPPLLQCLKQYFSHEEIDVGRFVEELERLAYYLFVTRCDVNTRIARYADVLDEIDPSKGRTPRSTGLNLSDSEVFDFFDALNSRVYLRSRVVKPLLLRLDLALSDGSAVYDYPIISVEHVCPQTIEVGSEWEEWFGNEEEYEYWLHRLANLVLLTHRKNARASNWDLRRKKEEYFKKDGATPFVLTRMVVDAESWTPERRKNRQPELLVKLAEDWGIVNECRQWLLEQENE